MSLKPHLLAIGCALLLLAGCSTQTNLQSPPTTDQALENTVQACPPVEQTQCPKPTSVSMADDNKIVIGEAERVLVSPPGEAISARIDTGATTSSIDARDIQLFERDGKPWVSFVLAGDNDQQHKLERPVTRTVSIKRHGGEDLERPVVKLKLELGGKSLNTELSLTDRSAFEYRLLIGRNFLKDIYIVDVSKKYAQQKSPEVANEPAQ
ncbi:MAG: ATP-dependent zinc protease [Halopseudomonas sp.]